MRGLLIELPKAVYHRAKEWWQRAGENGVQLEVLGDEAGDEGERAVEASLIKHVPAASRSSVLAVFMQYSALVMLNFIKNTRFLAAAALFINYGIENFYKTPYMRRLVYSENDEVALHDAFQAYQALNQAVVLPGMTCLVVVSGVGVFVGVAFKLKSHLDDVVEATEILGITMAGATEMMNGFLGAKGANDVLPFPVPLFLALTALLVHRETNGKFAIYGANHAALMAGAEVIQPDLIDPNTAVETKKSWREWRLGVRRVSMLAVVPLAVQFVPLERLMSYTASNAAYGWPEASAAFLLSAAIVASKNIDSLIEKYSVQNRYWQAVRKALFSLSTTQMSMFAFIVVTNLTRIIANDGRDIKNHLNLFAQDIENFLPVLLIAIATYIDAHTSLHPKFMGSLQSKISAQVRLTSEGMYHVIQASLDEVVTRAGDLRDPLSTWAVWRESLTAQLKFADEAVLDRVPDPEGQPTGSLLGLRVESKLSSCWAGLMACVNRAGAVPAGAVAMEETIGDAEQAGRVAGANV